MTTRQITPTQNGMLPRTNAQDGRIQPLALIVELDEALTGSFDLTQEIEGEKIDFVQTVVIDNYSNAAAFVLTCADTQQRLVCAANELMILPVIGNGVRFSYGAVGAAGVQLIFLNVPLASIEWPASGGGGGGTVPTGLTSPADITLATAVQTPLLAADPLRVSAVIVSDPANTANMRIGGAATDASHGALLQPGQGITLTTQDAIAGFATPAAQKVSITYTHN